MLLYTTQRGWHNSEVRYKIWLIISDEIRSRILWKFTIFVQHHRASLPSLQETSAFYFRGATAPTGPEPPHYHGFSITLSHTTLGRTPLYQWPITLSHTTLGRTPLYQWPITLSHTTLGRTPLYQWPARRRDLYWKHTELTRDRYSNRWWDSNSQLQQNSSRRPTPLTARQLGSEDFTHGNLIGIYFQYVLFKRTNYFRVAAVMCVMYSS